LDTASVRVIVVEDDEKWRHFFSAALQKQPEVQVIGEVSDGLEAVQKAQELQPDLILLDIGLPTLNGIEAARRIRKVSPASKILFISENRSADIAEAALSTGASGYVVKSDAASELLPAVKAVLEGKRFVSASLAAHGLNRPPDPQTAARFHRDNVTTLIPTQGVDTARQHVVGLYSNDQRLLDDLTQFVGAGLKSGNSAIVAATDSHRTRLLPRLQAYGVDVDAAIEEGRYVALGAAETLSAFMVNDLPDPVRFIEFVGDLIVAATEAAKGKHRRVSVFGECAPLLWAQGKAEAAIELEKLINKLTKIHEVDILCGYSGDRVEGEMDNHVLQQICAEHSAVHSR
jgi:DNA-binding NarL/FixJ family response regulator